MQVLVTIQTSAIRFRLVLDQFSITFYEKVLKIAIFRQAVLSPLYAILGVTSKTRCAISNTGNPTENVDILLSVTPPSTSVTLEITDGNNNLTTQVLTVQSGVPFVHLLSSVDVKLVSVADLDDEDCNYLVASRGEKSSPECSTEDYDLIEMCPVSNEGGCGTQKCDKETGIYGEADFRSCQFNCSYQGMDIIHLSHISVKGCMRSNGDIGQEWISCENSVTVSSGCVTMKCPNINFNC
eukprot:sb/3469126/